MPVAQGLSAAFPVHSRIDERGVLEIGGCDALELAHEFGTPAYIVAEDDLRLKARAYREAFAARTDDFDVLFASKSFPCTAVLKVFAEEGLAVDVATGGELHLALAAGFDPARIYLHGNAKSERELRTAVEAGVGHVIVDNADDLDKLERIGGGGRVRVLLRVTPDVRGATHDKISTGQADSKFGFGMDDARAAIARLQDHATIELVGLHAHIGSQLLELDPFRRAAEALRSLGDFPVLNLGGGLGVTYTGEEPPRIEDYVTAKVQAAGPGVKVLDEPGRSLVANAAVTLYTVQSVKRNVSTWVGVDGGMSDNLRPMLYGSKYEAHVVDRMGEPHVGPANPVPCHVAGKHCESGDVIVRDAVLDDPRPGDVVVTPATGAYGHAMANTYNGVPRPPVVFVKDGDARVVVRRESYEDLLHRDV